MWTIPHERWDKECSLLLSTGTEMNMSQAGKQPLVVILSVLVLWKTRMSTDTVTEY